MNKKRSPKECNHTLSLIIIILVSTKDYFSAYAIDFQNSLTTVDSPENRGRNAMKYNIRS